MVEFSIDRLKEVLFYNPQTGQMSWRVPRGRVRAGDLITCLNSAGYIVVRVDNTLMRAHRVAWAMTYGFWPQEIDHINGNRSDNRIENLRECTRQQNMKNLKKGKYNKSGLKGVSWHAACAKWQAHIKADGKNFYLGLFETKEEAHDAYIQASNKLHGVFKNHG
jgi:hypothetical protein